MIYLPSRKRAPRNAHDAFTLIELLVVVAIISLLAAILFPAFARARENARRTSCLSNLKQIALGTAQYAQDYDEGLPGYFFYKTSNTSDGDRGWVELLDPYTKSRQIFQCPSEPQKGTSTTVYYSDYFWNGNVGNPLSGITSSTPAVYRNNKLTRIQYPANVVLSGDSGAAGATNVATCNTVTGCPGDYFSGAANVAPGANCCITSALSFGRAPGISQAPGTDAERVDRVMQRHLEGANYAFVDGHVKWLKQSQLSFDIPNGSNFTFRVNDQ